MDKICTSIEQSKKLVELGLDVNNADMFWAVIKTPKDYEAKYACHVLNTWENGKYYDLLKRQSTNLSFVPAWSLHALLKLLPRGWKLINSERGDEWNLKCTELMSQVWFKSIFDAVYNTIFYLLENKKLE